MMADVAVVIPVYNRAQTVLETLNRVARQSLLPRRLVVVDDGSEDGSAAAAESWLNSQRASMEVRVIRQKNRGVSAARNRGLAEIRDCPYVVFLDSDDLWPNDFLARTVNVLRENPLAIAATCDQVFWHIRKNRKDFRSTVPLAEDATRWFFHKGGAVGSCSLFRRETISDLGGYNHNLLTGGDTELFLRVSLRGPWLHVVGEPVVYQHWGEEKNLSSKYGDCWRRWALILEDFVCNHGDQEAIGAKFYRVSLAYYWYRAGRQLMRAGLVDQAHHCFSRSLSWRFWRHKTWFRLAQTFRLRAA